jgi:DNA-directed RNA polymerase specialized sigma24 family protein
LDAIDLPVGEAPEDLLAVDEALQLLAQEDPQCAELVKLRFFAGLTREEAAATLGITLRSADRWWAFARSWLYDRLGHEEDTETN